jgi:predicted O-methyltransferase YrrM
MFEPDHILKFVNGVTRESDVQRRLRARTAPMPNAIMQITSDEAALLSLLLKLIGARKAIELGTYTGYSALAIASALPGNGTLVCCDISDEWTRIGKPFWEEAGVDERIDLRLGPALDTLRTLLRDGAGTFDFAFVDADKKEYESYYELILQLLRPGGLMVLDNMLWDGKVADESVNDADTATLRALNRKIYRDERVDAVLLTIRDGVTLVRKR